MAGQIVEADGTITLLGRGSVCINTAGEKVFPEEVEETLKTHPAVRDAFQSAIEEFAYGQVSAEEAAEIIIDEIDHATARM